MDDCDQISLLLGPFEDGELEPHEMQEVARHLADCDTCEATLNHLSMLGRELRGLVSTPSLEGFADAVDARIAALEVPWRERIQLFFGGFNERMAATMAMASLGAAAAILTAVTITPYLRGYLEAKAPGVSLAKIETRAVRDGQQATSAAESDVVSTVSGDSHAVISRLEAEMPSVAVWSEPENDTTVIWLPEQQQ